MKNKKLFSTGILSLAALFITVGAAYAAFSVRPWQSGTWMNLSGSERATQIRSWIDSNISEKGTLTQKPWEESGYSSLTDAEKYSKQRDWQYLQRRVSDEHEVHIQSAAKKVLNSHSTKEYFIPEKSIEEWNAAYNAIIGGYVPDLSIEDLILYYHNYLTAGHETACGIANTGAAYCWGKNDGTGQYAGGSGATGDGGVGDRHVPSLVSGGYTDWMMVDAYFSGSCGIRNGGELYCWGHNWGGSVGDGTNTQRLIPTRVGTATDWINVSVGSWYACGVRGNGRAYCWGHNYNGNLGIGGSYGSYTSSNVPVEVSGGYTDWESVTAEWGITCGIRNGGELYCWGGDYDSVPEKIGTWNDWENVAIGDLAVGGNEICGLRTGGAGYCWGEGDAPTLLSGGHTWVYIAEQCGITNEGRAYCWGPANGAGRIGDGTTIDRVDPTQVCSAEGCGSYYTDWVSISGQDNQTCGYRASGQAYCWGKDWNGTLGNNEEKVDSLIPVPLANITIKR